MQSCQAGFLTLSPLCLCVVCRDGYLYVPPTYTKSKPSPLLIMFHAAGKGAKEALDMLESQQALLDQQRVLVLLPESQRETWSLQMNG